MAKRQLEKAKKWPPHLILRQNKYINNIIEQDHRKVKWKMNHAMGYHTMWNTWATTTGVEVIHMLRKGQVPFISKKEPQVLRNFIHRFFDIKGPIFPTYYNRPCPFNS